MNCPRVAAVWRTVGWIAAPHLLSYRDLCSRVDQPQALPAGQSAIITTMFGTYGRLGMMWCSTASTPPSWSSSTMLLDRDLTLWAHPLIGACPLSTLPFLIPLLRCGTIAGNLVCANAFSFPPSFLKPVNTNFTY